MARSVWKGPFVDGYLLKKADESRASGRNAIIKTWSRRSTVLPQFVGLTFGVYNGKKFIPVMVTEDMIGHKLGEFSPTRFFQGHGTADKKLATAGPGGSGGFGGAPGAAPGGAPAAAPAAPAKKG
ncbi:MAG: 30S ribosomal protein S19 [Rhodospirillales bacterium]|nr:30S ribosomal protein S19 [Rhodospirillales bacterium]